MPQNSLPYAVSRTRVLENRLLTREKLQRILEASNAAEVLRALGEYGYGGTQQGDVQALIHHELGEAYEYVRRVTPNVYATGVLMLKGDCHNVKCMLKARLLQFDAQPHLSDSGTIEPKKLLDAVAKDDVSLLSEYMQQTAALIIKSMASEQVEVQWMECAMDNACFADMNDYAIRSKESAAAEYVKTQADLLNLVTLFRVKKSQSGEHTLQQALLPGGSVALEKYVQALEKTDEQVIKVLGLQRYSKALSVGIESVQKNGAFGLLEKQCDDVLLKLLRDKRYDRDGIAPLMGYLLAKEREAQAVRLVYMCKNNNVPQSMTQERLRELYA